MRIEIYVRPGSTTTHVGGTYRDALLVKVTARAHDGEATAAACKAVAESLSLPANQVVVFSGRRSRRKLLAISPIHVSEDAVAERVLRLRAG